MVKHKVMGIEFKTQKALMDYTRGILLENEDCKLTPMDDDFQFLDELLDRHPDRKDLGEIQYFRVVRNMNNAIALNICSDNNERDVSWVTCAKGKAKSHKELLTTAMRSAVSGQTQSFKNDNCFEGVWTCELCKLKVHLPRLIHVDHVNTEFKDLVKMFLALTKQEIPTDFYKTGNHTPVEFKHEDREFKKEWAAFHEDHTNLRMLCAKCNLTRKGYK